MDNNFMEFLQTATVQTPNYRGRYHQKYLAPAVSVSCEYVVEVKTTNGPPFINSGWVMFPPNTDVTNESIIMIDGLRAPIKSLKMMTDKRLHIVRGIKVTVGTEQVK